MSLLGWLRRRPAPPPPPAPAPLSPPPAAGRDRFPACVAFVLQYEGGYVDDPQDPGGATNRGITLATLSQYRGTAATKADVRNLTRAEAEAIYRKRYWQTVKGDDLPAGLDLAVFDFAVNSGPGRAVLELQALLLVKTDGVIGPATLAAAKARNPAELATALCERRLAFLRSLHHWPRFGRGWTARVEACRALAQQMASNRSI